MDNKKNIFSLQNISTGLLLILTFLLAIFFLSSTGISLEGAKGAFVSIFVGVAFILWLVSILSKGELALPKSYIIYSGVLVILTTLVSALFSPSLYASFFGRGFETGTFVSILTFFVLTFLISVLFKSKKQIFYFYLAIFSSFVLLALYQLLRLGFGPDFLSFGLFNNPVSSLIGKWNDLSIFFGLFTILALIAMELLVLSRFLKAILYVVLGTSLFLLSVINFSLIWIVLGLFSFVLLVYLVSFGGLIKKSTVDNKKPHYLPVGSIIVLIFSLVFLFTGQISNVLSDKFNTSQVEVRPSWSATLDITKATLAQDLLWGSGPNRFSNQWLLHKPEGINNDQYFWNTSFNNGIGIIPSMAVTTGIVGFVSWLVFLSFLFYRGIKSILLTETTKASRFLVIASSVSSLYLWLFTIVYVPGPVIFTLAFAMTGIFIASLAEAGLIKRKKFVFAGNPRTSFISVLLLVLLIIISSVGVYLSVQKVISGVYFQRSLTSLNVDNNLDGAEVNMNKALRINKTDVYYRSLSELNIIRLGSILNQTDLSDEDIKVQFQTTLGEAINNANKAVEIDETNYLNWVSLGQIYEALIPLKIEGAYENVLQAYDKALELNPHSPALLLGLARLEITNKDIPQARIFINKSLELKNNYTEAIFLLSQIEAEEGNLREAIKIAEQASLIAPNNVGVFFQLGLLKYQNRENKGAISALERAVILSPYYSNAKYFLGLTYYRVDRDEEAITQFEDLLLLNPDNEEVKIILTNMKNGANPFSKLEGGLPEDRDIPPLEEEN